MTSFSTKAAVVDTRMHWVGPRSRCFRRPGFFVKLFVFRSVISSGDLVTTIIAYISGIICVRYSLALFLRGFATGLQAAGAYWYCSATLQ